MNSVSGVRINNTASSRIFFHPNCYIWFFALFPPPLCLAIITHCIYQSISTPYHWDEHVAAEEKKIERKKTTPRRIGRISIIGCFDVVTLGDITTVEQQESERTRDEHSGIVLRE